LSRGGGSVPRGRGAPGREYERKGKIGKGENAGDRCRGNCETVNNR